MKAPFIFTFRLLLLIILVSSFPAMAGEADNPGKGVLATRGDGVVTQEMFDAHAERIPAENRLRVLRDKTRLEELINHLLITDQLAKAAEDSGLDAEPIMRARMELAAREELAGAWLVHYTDELKDPDYELMAREYWQVNRKEFQTTPTVDVTHILISNAERDDADALELATMLHERLEKTPSDFDSLVMEYSEDPSAASNKGRFFNVRRGQMTKSFEDKAFSLGPGEISGPVKSPYGYHLIRLDAEAPAELLSFQDVKQQLIIKVRSEHQDEARYNYLAPLYGEETTINFEELEAMVERHFGGSSSEQAPE